MKIQKIISKNGHEYIFVKQCNENVFQYKDLLYGYYTCFNRYDLGMIKEIVKPPRSDLNVEKVKI